MWYRDMREVGRKVTNESCFVCSHISHAEGADKLLFPKEIPPPATKCLLHLFLCRIHGQIQLLSAEIDDAFVNSTEWDDKYITFTVVTSPLEFERRMEVYRDMKVPADIMQVWEYHYKILGYFTFPTPPSKCHSPEHQRAYHTHDTCPCQWRPILHLKANIYFNSKWNGPHDLMCKEASLGSPIVGQEHTHYFNKDIERECAEIWAQGTRRYTFNEGTPYKPKRPYKLKSLPFCFLGNGTVPVGRNTNCSNTHFNSDLKYGTSSLMDIYWACREHIYLQLPPHWQGLCSIVTMHELHLVVPAANISHIHTHPITGDVTLLYHRKREVKKYFSDCPFHEIPQDFRLFNYAELFFRGVIPLFQTKANARWLQVTRYELMQLVNNTCDGFNAVKEEL
ncbi:uncharacterized protein LOC144824463 [Lissotriton helveticus]